MKKLFFFAAAALALASCSNDETVAEYQGEAISFRPLVSNVTRTNGPGLKSSFASGDMFNVYASYKGNKYFQDDFTSDGTTFSSTNKYYWPSDMSTSNKVVFTAIWGATQKANNPGVIEDYAPATTAASQMDVLLAKEEYSAKPGSGTNAGVSTLNFRHTLSQIVVNAKNSNPNLKVTISGVRVGYVNMQGDFNYGSGVVTTTNETSTDGDAGNITSGVTLITATCWTNDALAGEAADKANTYKYDQSSALVLSGKVDDGTAFTSGWTPWILLPQTQTAATAYVTNQSAAEPASANPNLNGSYLALKMTIENYVDDNAQGTIVSEQWCYWPVDLTWDPGKKYTYTIDVAGGGYQPVDTDSDGNLDPVLEGAVIVFSPTCTIDAWVVQTPTPVSGGI